MKMSFRWYGPDDPVTLMQIRQIPGMQNIVTAVYDVPPGEIWSEQSIAGLRAQIHEAGLAFEVVESVPVPEAIKLGSQEAGRCIENYCENIRRLGRAGVKCVCYNFMPVFDWLRSEMARLQPDGAHALAYEHAAVLAMKSGNVCVLRGGKEAYRSAAAIVAAMHEGLREAGLPETFVNLVSDPTRQSAQELMTASGLVDLLIPRGGAGLIRACVESATVPCIETGTGICHVYVDKDADLEKALNIIENAKTSRPSVCNAEEVALVHWDVAGAFLPRLKARLVDARAAAGKIPVELRLDAAAQAIIPGTPAGERDFDTEFLDYILAVKVVSDADDAIRHIAAHSTHHSDAIVTENAQTAERFTRLVDSAAVYVNASTRFTDGGEFGLGCEMGISTQKLHARGPMGLRELTTYKYIVTGDGQTR